jgi:hypothetical protein
MAAPAQPEWVRPVLQGFVVCVLLLQALIFAAEWVVGVVLLVGH